MEGETGGEGRGGGRGGGRKGGRGGGRGERKRGEGESLLRQQQVLSLSLHDHV